MQHEQKLPLRYVTKNGRLKGMISNFQLQLRAVVTYTIGFVDPTDDSQSRIARSQQKCLLLNSFLKVSSHSYVKTLF